MYILKSPAALYIVISTFLLHHFVMLHRWGNTKNAKHKNLDLSTKLLTKDKLATLEKLKADVSSISPSIHSDERLSTQLINPIFVLIICVF